MRERNVLPGQIFKTANGNLYMVLPNLKQAYLGNEDMDRCDGHILIEPRLESGMEIEVVGGLDPALLWVKNEDT